MCSLPLYLMCCKQKTAYEMRISDWSSDVCSSDLPCRLDTNLARRLRGANVCSNAKNGLAAYGYSRLTSDHRRTGPGVLNLLLLPAFGVGDGQAGQKRSVGSSLRPSP